MTSTKIIHKYIMKEQTKEGWVGYNYLCNWNVTPNWKKTDITNKKVNCKNCKRIIKKYYNENPKKDIIYIKGD